MNIYCLRNMLTLPLSLLVLWGLDFLTIFSVNLVLNRIEYKQLFLQGSLHVGIETLYIIIVASTTALKDFFPLGMAHKDTGIRVLLQQPTSKRLQLPLLIEL